MKVIVPTISKQIYPDQVRDLLDDRFGQIGIVWGNVQLQWYNDIYASFKDHDKFLIIIYLINKTLNFYSLNLTKLSYDQFYSKDKVEIEKFTVTEISNNLNIPKESARRKIFELKQNGVIKIFKKKVLIDRSNYELIKPKNTILNVSRFLSTLSFYLAENKILTKQINSKDIENIIKENFTYLWKFYYDMQIPTMLSWKKIFSDIETWHIWGLCMVNQLSHSKKVKNSKNKNEFVSLLISKKIKTTGINAMSISEISGIPRATVVRKLKKLLKEDYLYVDEKKHYRVKDTHLENIIKQHRTLVNGLSIFSTRSYNMFLT